jgi:flavin-dependent dehydrogenase
MPSAENPRVVVIGGGPAGSTCANILAQHGLRVRLYERERFPRFHIGESLMPDTYWVLRRLGMLDKMKSSQFVQKYSVQFANDLGKESQPFYFFENNPHECSQTWQVLRSEFDAMLLDNARGHGVDVRQKSRVLEVAFADGTEKATGVRVTNEDGGEEFVPADVVVDASGQSALISNKLKLREPDLKLKNASVWAYFQGAAREPGKLDVGATLVLSLKGKKGWFWYIPQHNDTVSVGVVAPLDYIYNGRKDPEQIFNEEVENCPAVKRRIEVGKRVSQFYSTKDYSYFSKKAAGDHWVLVGDAFGFLDPIYSSGLQLAFRSGEQAADAIAEGIAKGDLSGEQLGKWVPGFRRGMERLRKLVYAFYEGFNFGTFVRRYPDHKRHVTDLLIGDVFKDSLDEVWEPMAIVQRDIKAQEENAEPVAL